MWKHASFFCEVCFMIFKKFLCVRSFSLCALVVIFVVFCFWFFFHFMCLLLLAMKRLSLFKNHYCYEYCDVINLIFIHEIYNIHVYICNVLGEFMYNCENNKSWILIKLRKLVLFSLIPLWMAIGYPAIFIVPSAITCCLHHQG